MCYRPATDLYASPPKTGSQRSQKGEINDFEEGFFGHSVLLCILSHSLDAGGPNKHTVRCVSR